MVAYGVVCIGALSTMGPDRAVRRAQPSRNSFWEGCTFPKPYSGKVAPSRNPILGRLYLPEILFWEGCTFPKPYSGANHPRCHHPRMTGLRTVSAPPPHGSGGATTATIYAAYWCASACAPSSLWIQAEVSVARVGPRALGLGGVGTIQRATPRILAFATWGPGLAAMPILLPLLHPLYFHLFSLLHSGLC